MACISVGCKSDRILNRGMCTTCYNKWRVAGADVSELPNNALSPAELLRRDCENGKVQRYLDEGWHIHDVMAHYNVAKTTAFRTIVYKYELRTQKGWTCMKSKGGAMVLPKFDSIKKMALYGAW